MPKKPLTRAYLETLSFADLSALAENLGIDVPEHLHRSFLIGEMLEAEEEARAEKASADFGAAKAVEDIFDEPAFEDGGDSASYTATEISAVLRNPAWAFVFWSISGQDAARARQNGEDFFLRVSSFAQAADSDGDFYYIQISQADTSKHILCPPDKKFLRVELVASAEKKRRVLASSQLLELPRSSRLREDMLPGRQKDMGDVMALSGMKELLLDHYKNHRESFL